nr:putative reverse transcriptase, RNA-dependent DNA polymerase, Gag-polypeptide of LTR copia-type [Tanacetum cinerariifolium]
MNLEMKALHRNGTWVLADLPVGRKTIGSKWIYRIKYKASGEVDRYKARLVAQKFGQRECIDYEETFSQVVKMVTISLFGRRHGVLWHLDAHGNTLRAPHRPVLERIPFDMCTSQRVSKPARRKKAHWRDLLVGCTADQTLLVFCEGYECERAYQVSKDSELCPNRAKQEGTLVEDRNDSDVQIV